MNDSIELTSRAKLNWLLKVGPLRPDGYHDIQTVFQELALGEPMKFERLDQPKCQLYGYPEDIPADTNLVTKAWQLMKDQFPDRVRGLKVDIKKTLPYGGGLGGGSSNAACAIRALNHLYGLDLTITDQQALAARIGSDVAFFIQGGTASATGRGEVLQQLKPSPKYWIVLVVPSVGMSTAEAYRQLDSTPRPSLSPHTMFNFLTVLYEKDHTIVGGAIENDFELIAQNFSWFSQAKKSLDEAGAVRTFLCGSGSTVAALCLDETEGQRIALQTRGVLTYTW